jgi:uncharacterized protein HemY
MMKTANIVSHVALALALSVGLTGAGFVAAPAALAASKGPTVSPAVGKPLQEAQNLMKQKKFKEAAAKAQEAVNLPNKSSFETYMANEILGGAYLQAGDYANAAKALEASLQTGEVKGEDKTQHLKMLSQIYYNVKNYPKTLDLGGQYLAEQPNDAGILLLVGQSYYLQKDFKKASETLRKLIRVQESSGGAAKEDTYSLLLNTEHQLNNDAGVTDVLSQLVQKYPKPQYIKDLIAINERALRGGTTKTSLDIYVVKFNAGVFSEAREYTEMTELALQDGLPGLAKTVMEKGMAAGVLGQGAQKDRDARLLTMANTQADTDQKNLEKGESEAQKQKSGEALIKYGEAYWSYGLYDKAIAATEAGIAKGVADMNDAKLRLGIIYKAAGKGAQANEAFKGIAPGTVPAQIAQLWKVVK